MIAQDPKLCGVDAVTLQRWLDEDACILVDVREQDEYVAEHIPQAQLIPLSGFGGDRVPAAAGRKVVLQCRSGPRAQEAAQLLLRQGYQEVWYLQGGLQQWKNAELPTVSNNKAPLSIMRQVQIAAGTLVLGGTLGAVLIHPWFMLLPGFVGAGLIFAGLSGTCGMASLLRGMPWNRVFKTIIKSEGSSCQNPS